MAGMLNTEKPAAKPEGKPVPGNKPDAGRLSAQAMIEQMHLDPQQREQLDRIVLAGMKVMFDQKSHKMLLEQMNGPGTIPDKLGKGIAGLLGLLMQESQNSLPPNLLIPAGIVLMARAAEFLNGSGTPVPPETFAQAMTSMITLVLQTFGVDPQRVAAAGERGLAKGGQ